jgi:hypothetical protein
LKGFVTSRDDEILFVAGSDHRIRAWSTITGELIHPREATQPPAKPGQEENPLRKQFAECVQSIDVSEDFGLDLTVDGEIQRFGRDI